MKKRIGIIIFLMLNMASSHAQFTDRYWCFGDSSGIDFSNLSSPSASHSILRARGTCASICDSAGNLLFYAASPHVDLWLSGSPNGEGFVINMNHQIMENGDTLKSSGWYQEMVIIPNPGNQNQFYVFHIGVTTSFNPGFYYSIVDLSYNGGLGRVVQKNIQLLNFPIGDGLAAVKHGNGRDWWIVFKKVDAATAINSYYRYLVSPNGISGPFIQNIGLTTQTNNLKIEFGNDGRKMVLIDFPGNMELYDFDRCSGILSNPNVIQTQVSSTPYPGFWSCSFSPDNSKLYVTSVLNGTNQDTSYLFQYDLNAPGIPASKDTLYTFLWPSVAGTLQPGPDKKIYLSCSMEINDCEFAYLYCDTSYYPENMNISVINIPDSSGTGCDFQPFSFYLGGHRAYYGLPNNPNYELGPSVNSICDTLGVGFSELDYSNERRFLLSPNPATDVVWVNARKLNGTKGFLIIRDIFGNELVRSAENIYGGYLSAKINLSALPAAVYFVIIETENERLVQKLVKEN